MRKTNDEREYIEVSCAYKESKLESRIGLVIIHEITYARKDLTGKEIRAYKYNQKIKIKYG